MTNYEEKYKVLRNSINELKDIYGNEKGMKSIAEIADLSDHLEDTGATGQPTKTDMLTASKWNSMAYKERIALKDSNPEQFNNSLEGTFKEGN